MVKGRVLNSFYWSIFGMILLFFCGLNLNESAFGYESNPQTLNENEIIVPMGSGLEVTIGSFNPIEEVFYLYHELTGVLYSYDFNNQLTILDTLDADFLEYVNMQYIPEPHSIVFFDRGLGRVHLYDLEEKHLERLDESYNMRAFYNSSGYVAAYGNILTMGGYGEFRHKNALLNFDVRSKEWTEYRASGDVPEDNELGLFYLSPLGKIFISQEQNTFRVYLYVNDADDTWTHLGTFEVLLPPQKMGRYLTNMTNFRQIGPLLHVRGNVYYDYLENKIKVWTNGFPNTVGVFAATEVADTMFCMHSKATSTMDSFKEDLMIEKMPVSALLEEAVFETIRPNHVKYFTYGILVFIGLSGFLVVYVLARSPQKLSFERKQPMKFYNDRVEVKSRRSSELCVFYDELDLQFWYFMRECYANQVKHIGLEELDDTLFKGLVNMTQRSNKRNDLIKRVNKRLGGTFLTIQRMESDKRRKFINLDWDVLQ